MRACLRNKQQLTKKKKKCPTYKVNHTLLIQGFFFNVYAFSIYLDCWMGNLSVLDIFEIIDVFSKLWTTTVLIIPNLYLVSFVVFSWYEWGNWQSCTDKRRWEVCRAIWLGSTPRCQLAMIILNLDSGRYLNIVVKRFAALINIWHLLDRI